jgi:hypothetical protein
MLTIATSLIVLSACSPNSGDQQNQSEPNNDIVRLEAKSGMFTGANDFGTFAHNAATSKLVTFVLKNDGTEPLIGPAALDDTTAFSLTYSNCPASLPKAKSCTVKVSLDPRQLPSGSYSVNLTFDTVQVALVAIKDAPPTAPTGPAVQFLSGGGVITALDFGNITDKQNVLKTITIKNISSSPVNQLATLTGDYLLSYDTCSGKAIAKNSSCTIKISLNGKDKSGDVLGNLAYAGENLALEGNVTSVASGGGPAGSPNILFYQDNAIISGTVDEGNIYPTTSKQVILTLKNSGTLASVADTAVSNNAMFQIVYNQCSNKSLAINATCQVRVVISGQNTAVYGVKTSDIAFAGATVKLSINVLDPAGITTYEPVYSLYGSCSSVEPCEGAGSKSRTIVSCQKLVNNIPVSGGNLSDCAAFNIPENLSASCPSPAGNKTFDIDHGQQVRYCAEGSTAQSVVSTSCSAEYHEENNSCVDDVITYTASYSDYGTCSAMNACDGVGLKNRTIDSCQKYRNGTPEAGGQVSNCDAYNTNENLQATCDSPAGDVVTEITDLGIHAGTLTVTCDAGGMLPGTSRVAACDGGFEQEGEQCLKLNTLQVTKSSPTVGSIEVTGLTAPISCDTSCPEVNTQVRRDKTVNVTFTANSSNQYAFDSFSGDNAGCSGTQCAGLSLDSNKSLSINTHERKLVVLQETAGYSLTASGTGLLSTTAPTPDAGFTQAKAYYVENNTNVSVSITVVGSPTNVNTGWYVDAVKQAAPVGSSVSKVVSAITKIHATTGPSQQACGNTAGDYFGVATGQGKQAWNATTGLYASRCIPNNSSSCISGTFDDHGSSNNYIYRTATLFPTANDSQDPDPSYPYASGACVKNALYCGDSIPHSANAFRYSYSGENQYQSCTFDCEGGYRLSSGACVAKQLFVAGTTTGGIDLHKYNFDDNTLTKVSNFSANTNLLTVDSSNNHIYHQVQGYMVYKYDMITNTNTAFMSPDNLSSQINNAVVGNGQFFFIAGSFTAGTEIWRTPTNGTTATNPVMLDVYASGTASGFNGSSSIFVPSNNGAFTVLRAANASAGTEIATLNPFAAWNTTAGIVVKDLVAGTGSSIDTSITQSGVSFDSYTYFVGTNATVGTEIFRVLTSGPATANFVNMANVAAGATGSAPGLLTIWNNRLFYKATVGAETELYYTSNLTTSTANFTKVELVPGSGTAATGVSSFTEMKLVGNKMYVSLSRGDNSLGQELYVITETTPGTFQMTLAADINGAGSSAPRWFETDGKNLYFIASNGSTFNLYMHDGTNLRNLSTEKGITIGNPAFGGLRMLIK